MKISELINILNEYKEKYGDILVCRYSESKDETYLEYIENVLYSHRHNELII